MTKEDRSQGVGLLSSGGVGLLLLLAGLSLAAWGLGPDLEDGQLPKNPAKFDPNAPGPIAVGAGMARVTIPDFGGQAPEKAPEPSAKLPPPPESTPEQTPPATPKDPSP